MQNNIQAEEIDLPSLKASSNWLKCNLEDCCEILDYKRIPVSIEERKNRRGEIPYYGATGQIGWIDDYIFDEELLLLGEDGAPFFDKSKPISYIVKGKSWVNNHAHVLRALPGVTNNRFLKFYLDYFDFNGYVTGTTRLKLNQSSLRKISVFLPPLAEQHRIVAKLEKLLGKVDQAQARLEKIPGILKQFRMAVLAAACSGKLTDDWRRKNSNIPSAAEVIEDSIQERTAKYQTACQEAKQTGNKKPREYRVNNESMDDSEYDWLPETWELDRLCNLAHIGGGVTKGRKIKNQNTMTLPYLRVANVQDGYLDLSEIKEIEAVPEDLEKYGLMPGDILFTEGGDRDKLGRGSVWMGEIENCIHQNHIFRARLFSSKILPEYVSLATKSAQSRNYFFKNASQTVNLASINMTSLGNLPIPIPPFEEQKEIIRRVNGLYHLADQLERHYQKAKTHIDNLTQSILAKAFRGELVPQDPKDEPASELLKRIKAEKARQEAESKTNRKPKAKKSREKKRAGA